MLYVLEVQFIVYMQWSILSETEWTVTIFFKELVLKLWACVVITRCSRANDLEKHEMTNDKEIRGDNDITVFRRKKILDKIIFILNSQTSKVSIISKLEKDQSDYAWWINIGTSNRRRIFSQKNIFWKLFLHICFYVSV